MRDLLITLMLCLGLFPPFLRAQFFSACDCGSAMELDQSIRAHSEHDYRMDQKFLAGLYFQGKLPSGFSPTTRQDIDHYLSSAHAVKPAMLYYAYNEKNGRFCTWLTMVGGQEAMVSHVAQIEKARFLSLVPNLRRAMGIRASTGGRMPLLRNAVPVAGEGEAVGALDDAVRELSEVLFPEPVEETLLREQVTTLIIIPVKSIGAVPYAMLKIRGRAIVEFLSVYIAPTINAFQHADPVLRRKSFPSAVVVGDPGEWSNKKWLFPALPGARREAIAVGTSVGTTPLLGQDATIRNVKRRLTEGKEIPLIYFATHAIADFADPLDSSFVLLADGLMSARAISKLPLSKSRPLVVLSACQTGLGKEFDVGTIGLARAFHKAGASTIVMSLWSVNDEATAYLMTQFIGYVRECPVDIALRLAMLKTRERYPDPRDWAGFSLYGAPTLD